MRSTFALAVVCFAAFAHAAPSDYFAIHVVDADTGRGVPLVELQSTYKTRYYTDSAGYVAFLEPGLMDGRDVWFDVRSYGYESPRGPFDGRGVALRPTPGGTAEIKLKRTQIAERLYRQTGVGIYRDSVLLGKREAGPNTTLNARVAGSDTIQTAIYRGRYLWLWQDTDQLGFHLGNFSMTGATSPLPEEIDPDAGIPFTYFVNEESGFARPMAKIERDGSNPIWADGLTIVKDDHGKDRLVGRYVAVDHKMSPVETGLMIFNDAADVFERLKQFPGNGEDVPAPWGKPCYILDHGTRYAMYPSGTGTPLRVKTDLASVLDASAYETFTCLDEAGKVRRINGRPDWRWQRGAKRLTEKDLNAMINDKQLTGEELPVALRDENGKPVIIAGGSIAWSAHTKRWLYVFQERGGESFLGELWIASASSPEGPWRDARKIATHAMKDANMDCYNAIQHPELARGPYVYCEGTFVNTFSGSKVPTPYYNYNNLMYRVNLDDPRLKMPEPEKGWTSVTPAE